MAKGISMAARPGHTVIGITMATKWRWHQVLMGHIAGCRLLPLDALFLCPRMMQVHIDCIHEPDMRPTGVALVSLELMHSATYRPDCENTEHASSRRVGAETAHAGLNVLTFELQIEKKNWSCGGDHPGDTVRTREAAANWQAVWGFNGSTNGVSKHAPRGSRVLQQLHDLCATSAEYSGCGDPC